MRPITFHTANFFLTEESALKHVEGTLPRQVASCCGVEDDGFHCTLFTGHSGDHEAYNIYKEMVHTWHNCRCVHNH